MSPISLGVYGGAHVPPPPFISPYTYLGTTTIDNVITANHTFDNVPLGDAEDRTVILSIAIRVASGPQVQSVYVAGYPANIDQESPTWDGAVIARVHLPSTVGDLGTVSVTMSAAEWTVRVSTYVSYHKVARAYGSGVYKGSGSPATLSTTIRTIMDGFAIGQASNSSGVAKEFDWTGMTEYADDGQAVKPVQSTAGALTDGSTLNVSVTDPLQLAATHLCLACASYEVMSPNTLSFNRFDCKVPANLSTHVAARHTNYGLPLVASHNANTRIGDGNQADTLWFDSQGIYGARVLVDVGQSTNLKISTRIIGRVLSGATAGDRHYGIALGCPAPTAADGIGGLGYYLTQNGILTGGQITSGWAAQAGTLTTGIPMSDDMEMSVELSGLDVVVTIDGNVVYTTTLASPTVGNYAGAHVNRVHWNAMIGYKWLKVEAI